MQTAIFTPDSTYSDVLRAAGRVEIIGPHWSEPGLYEIRNLENGAKALAARYELSGFEGG